MLDLCDTRASNFYPVSQENNQTRIFRNKTALDLCDTCAGDTAAAFQTGYNVGSKASNKALSYVDIFTASALKTGGTGC